MKSSEVTTRHNGCIRAYMSQSYLNATYSGGSICVSGLLVHTGTDCSHRAITMLLILVEVACRSTTVTDCSHRATSMLLISVEVSGLSVGPQQPQTEGTELSQCYLFRWKYLCKWLVGPHRYRLQPQSHHHATYPSGSTCVSGLSVQEDTDCYCINWKIMRNSL